MNLSEAARVNNQQLSQLRKLVAQGEGQQLEFKKKAAHPEKIVRELIAFANTEGGILLIGVDDDKTISGVKYPEEEILAVKQAIEKFCRPVILLVETIIPISETYKKFFFQLVNQQKK